MTFCSARLADRAGIDHDEVGGFEDGASSQPGGQQPPGHLLGVAPVHLAAERPDVEARQGAGLGAVLGEPLVGRSGGGTRGARRALDPARSRTRQGSARRAIGRSRSRFIVRRRRRSVCRRTLCRMELLTNPETWVALADVDGARDRPRHRQRHLHLDPRPAAATPSNATGPGLIGLGLAMGMRILLLLTISWIDRPHPAAVRPPGPAVLCRDLILIGGGLFLLWKATTEIHESLEGEPAHAGAPTAAARR